ncbi:DUF6000 family protein [Planomonospora sp. ID67723]
MYLDELHATEHAARFLAPGGLWDNSTMAGVDPTRQKRRVGLMCEFAEAA